MMRSVFNTFYGLTQNENTRFIYLGRLLKRYTALKTSKNR